VSAANHPLLYCQPMPTGRSAGENNCRLTHRSNARQGAVPTFYTPNIYYTSDLSFIALYAGEMCGRIQGRNMSYRCREKEWHYVV